MERAHPFSARQMAWGLIIWLQSEAELSGGWVTVLMRHHLTLTPISKAWPFRDANFKTFKGWELWVFTEAPPLLSWALIFVCISWEDCWKLSFVFQGLPAWLLSLSACTISEFAKCLKGKLPSIKLTFLPLPSLWNLSLSSPQFCLSSPETAKSSAGFSVPQQQPLHLGKI